MSPVRNHGRVTIAMTMRMTCITRFIGIGVAASASASYF